MYSWATVLYKSPAEVPLIWKKEPPLSIHEMIIFSLILLTTALSFCWTVPLKKEEIVSLLADEAFWAIFYNIFMF